MYADNVFPAVEGERAKFAARVVSAACDVSSVQVIPVAPGATATHSVPATYDAPAARNEPVAAESAAVPATKSATPMWYAAMLSHAAGPGGDVDAWSQAIRHGGYDQPVSYTHLTLPTNREV